MNTLRVGKATSKLSETDRVQKDLSELLSLTTFVVGFFFPEFSDLKLENRWEGQLRCYLKQKGPEEMCKYSKRVRGHFVHYLADLDNMCALPIDQRRKRLPSMMVPFCDKINKDNIQFIRYSMTVLNMAIGIKLDPKLNPSPITNPWTGVDNISDEEISSALKSMGVKGAFRYWWSSFHWSTKSGPIGQAMYSAMAELSIITDDMWNNISTLGSYGFHRVSHTLFDKGGGYHPNMKQMWSMSFGKTEPQSLRRLSVVQDKEGKSRVVAILDYWTQTVLKPIHDVLMKRLLKRIRQDCTFNQSNFLQTLPKKGPYFSTDLESCTDRLPVVLQKRILEKIFQDSEMAEAWKSLLVDKPFTHKGESYSYAAGQPMGAYSSFPMMAITNHVLIRIAAQRVGKPRKGLRYCVLGDDMCLSDPEVNDELRRILVELGVGISWKSYQGNLFNFAKRYFLEDHQEISGYSIAGLKATWRDYPLLVNFMIGQEEHGFVYPKGQSAQSFIVSLQTFKGRPQHGRRLGKLGDLFRNISFGLSKGTWDGVITSLDTNFPLISHRVYSSRDIILAMNISYAKLTRRDYELYSQTTRQTFGLIGETFRKTPGYEDFPRDWFERFQDCCPVVSASSALELKMLENFGDRISWTPSRYALNPIPLKKVKGRVFYNNKIFSMRRQEADTYSKSRLVKNLLETLKSNYFNFDIQEEITQMEINIGESYKSRKSGMETTRNQGLINLSFHHP